jgi:hypothetical protein
VPRTEVSNLLLLLPGSKSFCRLLVLLLTVTATSEFGQESVRALAMVRHVPSAAWAPVVAASNSTTNRFSHAASAPRLPNPVAAVKLNHQNTADVPSDSHLVKQSDPSQSDLFLLVQKKSSAEGRPHKWVDLAAGYGQICGPEASIGEHSAELERPGCAYVKASFSF